MPLPRPTGECFLPNVYRCTLLIMAIREFTDCPVLRLHYISAKRRSDIQYHPDAAWDNHVNIRDHAGK